MNVTPLGFLESMEKCTCDLLRARCSDTWEWNFQRFLAFHDGSGSVQVHLGDINNPKRLAGVLHVRQVVDGTGSVLRGWMQSDGMAQPTPFVFHLKDGDEPESYVPALAERWTADLVRAAGTLGLVPAIEQPEAEPSSAPMREDPASP